MVKLLLNSNRARSVFIHAFNNASDAHRKQIQMQVLLTSMDLQQDSAVAWTAPQSPRPGLHRGKSHIFRGSRYQSTN